MTKREQKSTLVRKDENADIFYEITDQREKREKPNFTDDSTDLDDINQCDYDFVFT